MSYIKSGWARKYTLSPKVEIKQIELWNKTAAELDTLYESFDRIRDIPPSVRTQEQYQEKFRLGEEISRREALLIKIRDEDNPEYVKHWFG